MTVSSLVELAGGDMPLDTSEVLAMSVSELATDELVGRVRALTVLQEATSLLRSKYLREIRDRNYPITGRVGKGGDEEARAGWAEFLKKEFGDKLPLGAANAEIRGLESLEAAAKALGAADSEGFRVAPGQAKKSVQISNTLLKELGKANGCGEKIARRILTGEISGKRAVAAAVKEAKAEAAQAALLAGIKDVKPATPKPAALPVASSDLKMTPPKEGVTYSLSSYRGSPRAAQQREFIEKQVEKIRKAAVAYRNAVKQLEDYTFKGKADDRRFPSHMTAMAIVWKEEGFDYDQALADVVAELAEANRLWGLAMEASHGAAKVTE